MALAHMLRGFPTELPSLEGQGAGQGTKGVANPLFVLVILLPEREHEEGKEPVAVVPSS